jgi:hypothetical protein
MRGPHCWTWARKGFVLVLPVRESTVGSFVGMPEDFMHNEKLSTLFIVTRGRTLPTVLLLCGVLNCVSLKASHSMTFFAAKPLSNDFETEVV